MNDREDLFSFAEEKHKGKSGFGMDTTYSAYQKDPSLCYEELLRARAENENLRKRCRRDIDDAHKYAIQDFVTRMLPAKDGLEKGVDIGYMEENINAESLFEGMTATLKIMNGAFKAVGLEEVEPIGHQFDPELHEAMLVRQVEDMKPNQVLSVFQKGYLLNGRLIRPARVEVSG